MSEIRIGPGGIEWKGEAFTTRRPRGADVPVAYVIHVSSAGVDIISADGRTGGKISDVATLMAVSQMASDMAEEVARLCAELREE